MTDFVNSAPPWLPFVVALSAAWFLALAFIRSGWFDR